MATSFGHSSSSAFSVHLDDGPFCCSFSLCISHKIIPNHHKLFYLTASQVVSKRCPNAFVAGVPSTDSYLLGVLRWGYMHQIQQLCPSLLLCKILCVVSKLCYIATSLQVLERPIGTLFNAPSLQGIPYTSSFPSAVHSISAHIKSPSEGVLLVAAFSGASCTHRCPGVLFLLRHSTDSSSFTKGSYCMWQNSCLSEICQWWEQAGALGL